MSTIRILFLFVVGIFAIIPIGCGDDPTSPVDTGGGDTLNLSDAPLIPKPQAPNDDPGATSDTMTTISAIPLPDFAPWVNRALVDWLIGGRQGLFTRDDVGFDDTTWCDSTAQLDGEFWSDNPTLAANLFNDTIPGCDFFFFDRLVTLDTLIEWFSIVNPIHDLNPFPNRFILRQNNAPVPGSKWSYTSRTIEVFSSFGIPDSFWKFYLSRDYRPIQAVPYLRRDRFWRRRTLEGSGANWLLLSGPVSGDIETSFTRGAARTETESFARSLSITVGGDYKIFSNEIQGTIEQSFESTIEISEESTVSFTKSVSSQTGQVVQFMVWELVDIYTITDSLGNPLTDPNYGFNLPPYQINGIAISLDATVWE